MKKLMIALAAAATTMFSFGDLPTGTSFEAFSVGPKTVGDIVTKDDTGDQDGLYKYWYSTAPEADELGAITNDVASGVSRPDMFAESSNTNSLQIDTTAPLVRTALPNAGASSVTGVAIGDGIYLDTLVKFTAADEAFAENLTGGDKIAIEYVEHEAEEGDVGYTNFVVRAGFVGGADIVQTNYFAAVPDGFNKDEWHRLTVRTIANVGDDNVGFVIYLDGDMNKTLEYSTDVDAGFGTLNALAQTFYNSEKHALFPSAIAAGATGGSTISSVAFSGNGFIDDVSFTATKPTFINEAIRVTIAWDEHVTGMKINGTTLTSEQVAAKSWTGEPNNGAVIAIPTFDTGYVAGAPVLPEGATYNYNSENEEMTFGNLAAGMTCTIKSMFPLYEVNGVSFDDLDAALTAAAAGTDQAPATLKLLADCNQALNFTEGYIVLDLAGCDIQGNGSDFSIGNSGATLIITNSGAEASILIPADNGAGGVGTGPLFAAAGFTTIQAGTFEGVIYSPALLDQEDSWANYMLITGGKFIPLSAYDPTDPTSFYLYACVAQGLALSQSGDYVQVGSGAQPIGTYTVTVTPNANATYAAAYKVGGETITPANDVLTVTVGQTIVITATPAANYEYAEVPTGWTAGQDGKITIEVSAAGTVAIPAPSEKMLGTYQVTVTPTANATYAAAYNDGGAAVEFVNDVAAVTVGKTITITATPGSGYEYAETPTGWTAGQDGKITIEVSAEATVAIPAPTATSGKTYPSYIPDDATEKGKYDAWATYAEISPSDFPDATGANQDAYLLNCKPSEVAAAKAAFKFTSISYDTTQSKWVTATTTSYNERGYNGEVVVKQYSDVGCKSESSTGTFFKAFLQ